MAKDKSWLLLAVVGVFVAYFLNLGGLYDTVCGNYNFCLGSTGSPAAPAPGQPAQPDICIYDGATMTIGPMQEMWNPATTVSDRGVRVFVNDVDRGIKVDESTLDVNYGDDIVLYYAENETDGAAAYYVAKEAFTVPCTSAFSTADQGDAEKLYAYEGSANALNFKVFCEDDGLLNAIGTNSEDLASGDVISLEFSVQPTFEDAWSPFCKGVVVIDGNGTAYDDLIFNGWEKAPIPAQHTTNATTYEEFAYYVPTFSSVDGAYSPTKGTLTVDASSSGAFSGTKSLTLNVTWYDCDWFRDANTGAMKQGVEDETNSDVGGANYKDTIWMT